MKKATEHIRYEVIPDEKWLKELREHQHEYFTFDSAYSISQLKNFRKRLITSKFIDKDITEAQFAAIFKGQMFTSRIKPIVWQDSKENLRFFLETLIPGITIHKFQVAACFNDPSGKPIQINKPNRSKENIVNNVTIKGKKAILQDIIFKLQ